MFFLDGVSKINSLSLSLSLKRMQVHYPAHSGKLFFKVLLEHGCEVPGGLTTVQKSFSMFRSTHISFSFWGGHSEYLPVLGKKFSLANLNCIARELKIRKISTYLTKMSVSSERKLPRAAIAGLAGYTAV